MRERTADVEATHAELISAGVIAPVEIGGTEERTWLDCDLASLAENRLGDRRDPALIDEPCRQDWRARATTEREMRLSRRSDLERSYWILDGRERAGTIALANDTLGGRLLRMSSLYVLPSHRGRGLGRRMLESLRAALARHDLGLRLETSWSWQRTVRFYVAFGLWVRMWKRELDLTWDPWTPPPHIEVRQDEAQLSIPSSRGTMTLVRAARRGDVLELEEPAEILADDECIGDSYWNATGTLSLSLALHAWPLVRSAHEWERCRGADAGPPESLARKITIWEAFDRHHGFRVDTPRIPGLAYPTWEQLEARWAAEREAFEAETRRPPPRD